MLNLSNKITFSTFFCELDATIELQEDFDAVDDIAA